MHAKQFKGRDSMMPTIVVRSGGLDLAKSPSIISFFGFRGV